MEILSIIIAAIGGSCLGYSAGIGLSIPWMEYTEKRKRHQIIFGVIGILLTIILCVILF